MRKSRYAFLLVSILVIGALVLGACAQKTPEPTAEPMEEPTEEPEPTAEPTEAPPELGSEERPIQVYFVPSAEMAEIVAGGEVMANALEEATGLKFEVYVPTSYAAAVEGMCAAPEDAMGFPATFAYVVANARCGVDASFISVRYGRDVYWSQFLVQRDSDIETLQDLEGKKWGYTDATSTSGHIVPMILLQAEGIEVAEKVATGGHSQAALAVYNEEVDFSNTYFSPPVNLEDNDYYWEYGDDPEPYADIVDECSTNEDGNLICGEYLILDARNTVVETAPDVMQQVRILTLSESIPNDVMAFGPEFPADLRAQIEEAMLAFKETDAWEESIGDFYSWDDIKPVDDSRFDSLREKIEKAGFEMDEVIGFLEE